MRKGLRFILPLFALLFLSAGCATHSHDLAYQNNDPFYQGEEDNGTYGEKTPLDRVMQLDPGQRNQEYSPTFLTDPPRKIAILPFENLEGGDFKLNGVPIPGRDNEERENKSWTNSNRLRKFFFAYMSLREFELISLLETDAILKELGITNPERLYSADPCDLASALGVDALVYGKVTHHRAHYFFLFSQLAVGLSLKCISGEDGSDLFEVSEVRRDNKISVALNPIDMAAASVQNLFSMRNLHMARAADEVCREIVSKIPVAELVLKERELYWKELVASNQRIQAIKEKIAIANGDEAELLTDGGVVVAKEDGTVDTADINIKSDEGKETLEGVTEGVQLANADGVVRAAESATLLAPQINDHILEEAKESVTAGSKTIAGAMAPDSFTYTLSVPGLAMDVAPHVVTEVPMEKIARANIVYRGKDEDTLNADAAATEIDASDIIYSNKGVLADIQTEIKGNKDGEGIGENEIEDLMNEIIEMSISDIIYSSKDLPSDGTPEAPHQDVTQEKDLPSDIEV
ncbi:MAG: hypothetical protein ACE5KK_03185 [Candidatus Brocadiales bacterium]